MVDISTIIRCKNEERWIGHAIQSVLDALGQKAHIVVVDNGSIDDSMRIVSLFNERFRNIDVVNVEDYTPGGALNGTLQGWVDKGHLALLLSAHCQLKSFDMDIVEEYMQRDDTFGIIGKQVPIYLGKKITPRYIWSNFQQEARENIREKVDGEVRYFFHNAFSVVKRDLCVKHPFDIQLSGKEDRYWALEMVERGYNFKFDPKLVCHHHWTPNGATWKGIG